MYNNYPNQPPYGRDERGSYPPEGYRPENYQSGGYQPGGYQPEYYRPEGYRPYPPAPQRGDSFSEAGLAIAIGLGLMFLLMVGFHSFFFFPVLFFFWPFFFWGPRRRRYYRRNRYYGRPYDPYNPYNQGYYQGWGQYPLQGNYPPPPQGWPQSPYRSSGWPEPPQTGNPDQPGDPDRNDY